LQLHLTQRIDQSTHITQERVLGRIAQRFPKYKSVISAIPAMAECIPEDLKRSLGCQGTIQVIQNSFGTVKDVGEIML
jgi:hypothetical protein